MYQPKVKVNFNSLISTLLVVALLASIVGAQTSVQEQSLPIKRFDRIDQLLKSRGISRGSKLDRETVSGLIRAASGAQQKRLLPQIKHLKGVGTRREGVAPAKGYELITTTAIPSQNAPARTIVVTSTADNGPGSLRQALADVSNRGTINITATGTIALVSGELFVNSDVTIRGPGAANLSLSGSGGSRVFHIAPGKDVMISNLTITNGNAINLGKFPLNTGGGIYNDHAKLSISGCILSGNTAYWGGGIYSNSEDRGTASVIVTNSTFSGNSAQRGGGIYSDGDFAESVAALTLNDTTLNSNSASVAGGAIFSDGYLGRATLILNNTWMNNNSASLGGAVYNNGDSGMATATVTECTMSGNAALDFGGGGAIFNDGSSSDSLGSATFIVKSSTVAGNSGYQGGAIYNLGATGRAMLKLSNSTVKDNSADFQGSGGGIDNDGFNGNAVLTINDTTVSGNSAGVGAGILNFGASGSATLTLTNDTMSGNTAHGAGGAIYNDGALDGRATLVVIHSTLSGNRFALGVGGGAIYNDGQSGFAISTVNSTMISDNDVLSDDDAGGFGSGISNNAFAGGNAILTLSDSIVRHNQGAFLGGGIFNDGSGIPNVAPGGNAKVTLTNSIVDGDNEAVGGGGIFNIGRSGSAELTLNKSSVNYNRAYQGGGINNDAGTLTLIESAVKGNECSFGGGGIESTSAEDGTPTTVTLTDSTIADNIDSSVPGIESAKVATDTVAGNAILTLNNSTVSGNMFQPCELCTGPPPPPPNGISGFALLNSYGTLVINNSTVSGNDGVGIGNVASLTVNNSTKSDNSEGCILNNGFAGNSILDISNTILNSGPSGENLRNWGPGVVISHGYNLSSDAAGGDNSTNPGGVLNGPQDIRNTNPLLGPLQNNGGKTMTHALLWGSPAIDAGDPNFDPKAFEPPLRHDQRDLPRFPRVINDHIDIGAFESKNPGTIMTTANLKRPEIACC